MRLFAVWIVRSQALRIVALSLSYLVSLLIFQRGLLIKRQVLPHKSSCSDPVALNEKHCWLLPRYNKSILLIIDALRYDFIFPYKNDGNGKQLSLSDYHHGQMSKIAQLLREQPRQTALFPFIADAPTTTFQRIKALVTGNVPAFIEAGNNFGGIEISEDNIVDQLLAKGQNVTLLGDETWVQLLPGRFHRHFEEPSFDIKDLDTVDDSVIAHIFDELDRPDWSLLIAHCLGVDHAGHRYGPSHPEMTRKLRQMDQLVWNLTREMPEDAILFVLGDHGMTVTGDHGGDSTNERTSAILGYTRREDGFGSECQEKLTCGEKLTFNQVDLAPTLAFLLDLPIPFSSIGKFIHPFFSGDLQREIRLNSFQVLRYAQEYAKYGVELRDQLQQIIRQYGNAPDDFESNEHTIEALQSLIRTSLDSQFQWIFCFFGLLSLADALIFNCYLLINAGIDACVSGYLWIFRSALLLLQLSLIFANQLTTDQIIFSLASLTLSLVYQILVSFPQLIRGPVIQHSLLLALLGQLFLSMLPFSNSYIIYESDVLRFAIQSLVIVTVIRLVHLHRLTSLRQLPQDLSDSISFAFMILLILRIMKFFENCREEQVQCISYKHSESQLFLLCILVSFGSAYILLEQLWSTFPITKAFVWPMTALLCVHWLFELSIHSMHGGNKFVSLAGTISTLEMYSRVLSQIIFAALFAHHFVLNRWEKINEQGNNAILLQPHYQILSVPLMMIMGPIYGWNMALILAMFPMAEQLFKNEKEWTWAWFLHLLGAYTFFGTGNQQTLSSIPWRAAFVGLPGNFPYKALPALLVLISMFAGSLLASLMTMRDERGVSPLYLLLFGAIKVFGCSAASLLHQQHLMFYKVFAPKFVFESVGFLFCCAFVVFWFLTLRINHH